MLAYPMLELGLNTDVIWRVLLGVGALPGLLVLYLRLRAGNVRGCRRNGETETVVVSRDEPVGDVDSASRTSTVIRTESFELTAPNQRSEDEFNAESTLFCDVTSSVSEEALVENSHLEDDVKHIEKQLNNQDDACKDDVSTSPIRDHSRSL
jgi:prephenate dehydrogenase